MAAGNRGALRSTLLVAVYAASLCLVLSFILFEVLDIDGSDFPTPLSRALTVVKLTEPPHDLKRGFAEPLAQSWIPVSMRFEVPRRDTLQRRALGDTSLPSFPGPRRDRATLARASLAAPSPSA